MKSKICAIVLTISISVLNLSGLSVAAEDPEIPSSSNRSINYKLTKNQAIEDIEFFLDKVKQNNIAAIENIPDEVLDQKEIEISKLPEELTVIDEWKILSRIASKLHDGHTPILIPRALGDDRLPFDVEVIDKKFFCTSGDLKGFQITAINGISIEDLYENFKMHSSYEIEEWPQYCFFDDPSTFIPSYRLERSGINTFDPIEVTFENGAETINRKFELVPFDRSNMQSEPWVSYKIDKENGVAVFTLNDCTCNEEYLDKVKNFFREVHQNNIKNIVVDLRKNLGGDSRVIDYFSACLKEFNYDEAKNFIADIRKGNTIELGIKEVETKDAVNEFRKNIDDLFGGDVFILTSHGTFSSGMWFATLFSDNNWAKVVGEVPGTAPESFGDHSPKYVTPNSKYSFYTSIKKYYRPDRAKKKDRLIPDFEVSAKDALNKVYEIIGSYLAE